MPLSDKQLRLLEAIDAGNTTGDRIADAMGSSMQMIRYYLDTMAEDGYLKAAKVYDNSIRDFQIVRAYLTEKGKTILQQNQSSKSEATVESQEVVESEKSSSQNPFEDFEQIVKALGVFQKTTETLPDDRREIASVYLEDLETEMKIVYRRKPHRIKAYFLAFVGMSLPIVRASEDAKEFIEQARFLSNKFNIPLKLPRQDEG